MAFDPTPSNMTELLVVALAAVAAIMLLRKKYDSNLPLLFYFAAVVVTNAFDRPVNPYLMYTSLAFALLLRFEFMGTGIAKVVAFLATIGICLVGWAMMQDVLV
jgi:hypothetical protein